MCISYRKTNGFLWFREGRDLTVRMDIKQESSENPCSNPSGNRHRFFDEFSCILGGVLGTKINQFSIKLSIPIYGQKRTWPEWPTSTDEVGEWPVQSPKTRSNFESRVSSSISRLQARNSNFQHQNYKKKIETRISSLLQNSKTGPSKRQACSRTSKHGGGYIYIYIYIYMSHIACDL